MRLILGECLGEMQSMSEQVDHIICDPPYAEVAHTQQLRLAPGGGVRRLGELDFSPMHEEDYVPIAEEMTRLARRWVIVFCTAEQLHLWRGALTHAGLDWVRAGI